MFRADRGEGPVAAAGISFLLFAWALVLAARIPVSLLGRHSAVWPLDPTNLAFLIYAAVGGLIAARRPGNPIGWIFLIMGLTWEAWGLTNNAISYTALLNPGALQLMLMALWLPSRLWMIAFGVSPLVLLLFPNGRLLSRRWKPVFWLLAAGILVALLSNGALIEAGSFSLEMPSLLQQAGAPQDPVQSLGAFLFLLEFIFGAVAIILRFRRSQEDERQQLKWFSYAGVFFILVQLLEAVFYNQLKILDSRRWSRPIYSWGSPAQWLSWSSRSQRPSPSSATTYMTSISSSAVP